MDTANDTERNLDGENNVRKRSRKKSMTGNGAREHKEQLQKEHDKELLQFSDEDIDLKRVMDSDSAMTEDMIAYNIIPLDASSSTNAIISFPEKDNVANQREHIVHLLANEQSRLGIPDETEPKLDVATVQKIFVKSLENYINWCNYLCIQPVWSRNAYNMVLHKFGEKLYLGLVTTMTSNLREISQSIESAQGEIFLEELNRKWVDHNKALQMIRDILMYMDRTFIPSNHKTPVHELGLNLWRDVVIHSSKTQARLLDTLLDTLFEIPFLCPKKKKRISHFFCYKQDHVREVLKTLQAPPARGPWSLHRLEYRIC